jgi:hypothetical protein
VPTPNQLDLELFYGGVWNNVDPYLYQRDQIVITRGRQNEQSVASPMTATLTLNNRDGRFSPRNPNSPLYGLIGRNTPVLLSESMGERFLLSPGGTAGYLDTPDSAALSITGDLDVRADAWLPLWESGGGSGSGYDLASKYAAAGQRSWRFYVFNGYLFFTWSADGTALINTQSTIPLLYGPPSGRLSVRATIDVNNGAGGSTVTFYTSTGTGIAGPWVALGTPVVTAGVTSVFDSTALLRLNTVGSVLTVSESRIYAAELRNGIGGTVVANPDLRTQGAGASGFTDAAGAVWTVRGSASISNRRTRFAGEVSSWPVKWDVSGKDVYVQIEAAGPLRRYSQGDSPVLSSLRRGLLTIAQPPLRAYWPMEELATAAYFTSATGGQSGTFGTSKPALSSYSDLDGSDALPVFDSASATFSLGYYVPGAPQTMQVRWVMWIDSAALPAAGTVLLRAYTGGSIARWDVIAETGINLRLRAYSSDGVQQLDSGLLALDVYGRKVRMSLEATQNGTGIDWGLVRYEQGAAGGGFVGGNLAAETVLEVRNVIINPGAVAMAGAMFGHLTVESTASSLFDVLAQFNAYNGETAGTRLRRLCSENAIAFNWIGYLAATARMGAQRSATFLDLMRECEKVDQGILSESRDRFGMFYRTRNSMFSQLTRLTLDYAAKDFSDPLVPVDDDQSTRNDVTVVRDAGASYRATLDVGALSTAAPPSGVGRYDDSTTLNAYLDTDLPDQAGWRLHLGTADESRFPSISAHLNRTVFTDTDRGTLLDLEIGDRVVGTNTPAWIPGRNIEELAIGTTEILTPFEHLIATNCVPARPYDVAVYDSTAARYSSSGSTLVSGVAAGVTSLSIATAAGPPWSVADGSFNVLIQGEELTVTAISGATSPQTFTVTRAVNGISKALTAGATMELSRPVYYGS